MDTQERELREDRVGRSVRAALSTERAPRAWTLDALAAPASPASSAMLPREESRLLVILPHLLGVALLLGLGLSALLRPGMLAALDGLMKPLFADDAFRGRGVDLDVAGLAPWLAIAAPLIVLVLLEATRGFAFVRRWFS